MLVGDHLCWVDASITCLKTSDGSVTYKERLYSGNNEHVSAVAAGDKIYALTRLNGLFILKAGAEFDSKYSRFTFKGDDSIFNASPAISDGRLYLRSNEYLYCVGKK